MSERDDMMGNMSEEDGQRTRWMEPAELLSIVQRDVSIRGIEAPADAIMREPKLLIPVPAPANPPLDIPTYEARFARWRGGEGPRLTGMETFMDVLTSLPTSACAVSVHGESTTYCFLLDETLTRVLAAVALDPPD
jgi:hypothetical protein